MFQKLKADKKCTAILMLTAALLAAYLIVFGIINFCGFEKLVTTDIYEDTLVARMMWEQGTIFPNYYVFGNQLYVIATPVLSALFYGLTGSMNLAMKLATTLMGLLVLLSMGWMLRPLVKDRRLIPAALLCFACAVYGRNAVTMDEGQLFFTLASFYACYTISFFVILGDYARAIDDGRLRPAALLSALLLCFCTGMQSLRQTCISILPILAFELFRALIRLFKKEKLYSRDTAMPMYRALAYTAANLLGYAFAASLHIPQYTIYDELSAANGISLSGKLAALIRSSLSISGIESVRNGSPFFALMFVFFTALLVIAAVKVLLHLKSSVKGLRVCWLVCAISIMAVVAASFCTRLSLRSIYLFIYYPLLALSFLIVAEDVPEKLRHGLCLLLTLLALLNIGFSYGGTLKELTEGGVSDEQLVVDYAIDNGYELIYGRHSDAVPRIAVRSDGALIGGGWSDEEIFHAVDYINIRSIYYKEDYARAIFVLMPEELEGALEEASANKGAPAKLTVVKQIGKYSLCTASRQFMYTPSEAWDLYSQAEDMLYKMYRGG